MTYAELVRRIEVLAATTVADDTEFAAILPAAIESGEMRCLRDCDFPSARRVTTVSLAAGAAAVSEPAGMVVPRALWLRTGVAGQGRKQLERRDASYLHEFAPDSTTRGEPRYFATQDAGFIRVAPAADLSYSIEVEHTFRPAGLSSTVTTTWLSERYPDLLVYAIMIFVAGYQKNFGQQADDPQMPGSWGRLYAEALAVARNEAATGKGWGPFDRSPAPAPSSLAPAG